MKQFLFTVLAILTISSSAQKPEQVSLGTIRNKLTERNLEITANYIKGDLYGIEIECPVQDQKLGLVTNGTIIVKADDLQQFRDVLCKLRPAMDILKVDVEKNGYEEASLGLDNIPFKVTYKWGALNHENKGDFEVFVTRDANGCYWSSIRHMAKNDYEDGEECPFFLQFRSLYEVDYMLTILSDENITLSKKKHDLLVRIKQDTN